MFFSRLINRLYRSTGNLLLICLLLGTNTGNSQCSTCTTGGFEHISPDGDACFDTCNNVMYVPYDVPNGIGSGVLEDSSSNAQLVFDLAEGFSVSLRALLGTAANDSGYGFVIVLATAIENIRTVGTGASIGFEDTPDAIGLVVDTHYDPGGPFNDLEPEDNFRLHLNSIYSPPLIGPKKLLHTGVNTSLDVEDGSFHRFEFKYSARDTLFEVFVDGLQRVSHGVDLMRVLGARFVFPGIYGASGSEGQQQIIGLGGQLSKKDPKIFTDCELEDEFGEWSVGNGTEGGAWQIPLGRRTRQQVDGPPTMLLSVNPYWQVEYTFTLEVEDTLYNGAANDLKGYIGFGIGTSRPFAQDKGFFRGLLWDWGSSPACPANPGTEEPGFSLAMIDAEVEGGCDSATPDYLTSHQEGDGVSVLNSERSPSLGWQMNTPYQVRVRHQRDTLGIWVTGPDQDTLYQFSSNQGSFPAGRFACYTHAQGGVTFTNFRHRLLLNLTTSADTVCLGESVTLTPLPGVVDALNFVDSLEWDFGDGTRERVSGVGTGSVTHRFTQPGRYRVRLLENGYSCFDLTGKTIFVVNTPTVSLPADTTLCPGDLLHLVPTLDSGRVEWSDGSVGPTFIVQGPGVYSVRNYVGDVSCPGIDSIAVSYADTIDYTAEVLPACPWTGEAGAVVFRTSEEEDGLSFLFDGQAGREHTNLDPGQYGVLAEDAFGCLEEATVLIEAGAATLPEVPFAPPLCSGEANGRIGPLPDPGRYAYAVNGVPVAGEELAGLSAGMYNVEITDTIGCAAVISIGIPDALPLRIFGLRDTSLFIGDTLHLRPRPNPLREGTWTWTGTDLMARSDGSASLFPEQRERYRVNFTTAAGCTADTSFFVTPSDLGGIYVPTVFSPNGDGINDFYYPRTGRRANSTARLLEMNIYNRWGVQVFRVTDLQPDDPAGGWNGSHSDGRFAPPGVYVVVLIRELSNGEIVTTHHDIVMIR